jgi:hypothetical protein
VIGLDGVVTGDGTLHGTVHNGGVIAPDGALRLRGAFTQGASGGIVLALRGDGHDALRIDGAAALGGTLRVAFGTGFAPLVGASCDLLTADPVAGAFDRIIIPPHDPAWTFDLVRILGGLRLFVLEAATMD